MFWLLLIHVAAGDAEDGLPKQEPTKLWYMPTAPYPARWNLGVQRRAFHLDPKNKLSDAPNQKATGNQDLFGPDPLGPEDPTTTLLPETPEPRGPYGPQAFDSDPSAKEQNYEVEGVLDGPPEFREAIARLNRPAPMPFDLFLRSQAFAQNRLIRPGEKNDAHEPALRQGWQQPMNPWYAPAPTDNDMGPVAMGPYSERRLRPMLFSPTTAQPTLAPLRDIEHTTKSFDSWLRAHVRGRTNPTRESDPLAPPSPPVLHDVYGGKRGKMSLPKYPKTGLPLSSAELSAEVTLAVTRRPYVPSRLFPDFTETTTHTPPPLLGHDDVLEEWPGDNAGESGDNAGDSGSGESGDNVSLFSEERKQLLKLRKEPTNTFDNILL